MLDVVPGEDVAEAVSVVEPASVVTDVLDVVSLVKICRGCLSIPASVVTEVLDVVPGEDVVEAVSVAPASVQKC